MPNLTPELIPEPKTAWEWVTGGVFAILAVFAGISKYLRGRVAERERPTIGPMAPTQLDRMEKSIDMLCRTLTVANEDGYPVSASRKLAGRLEERLDRIEKAIQDTKGRA